MKLYKRNRLVQGVGVNDVDYNVNQYAIVDGKMKIVWRCPFYCTWQDMLVRCYSDNFQSKRPTYLECSVYEDWLVFSNFKAWMESQDWEGKQLDKDLLLEGNKVYSPDTCLFIPQLINSFLNDQSRSRGNSMIGACWDKSRKKYISGCRNPFTGMRENLGRFTDELDAHLAWKTRKHELACLLADSELVSDPRLAEALKTRYIGDDYE